ncbi:MAG: OsmC family protein [Firmicutes bacterium]|nr:OsmC family protein [Bacillota bacterium]
MNATVRWNQKMSFVGKTGSNHSVVMDTSALGGDGAAPSPMEMVLLGLAGCSGIDVVSILNKKRVNLDNFEIRIINAERADEHPKVFTKVEMEYAFSGEDLNPKHLEDAVALSIDKYCSVAGMLKHTAKIDWRVVIE